MKIKEITNAIEEFAPLFLQESYDNAGLLVGNYNEEVSGVLISLDVTEEIIDEAISKACNLIVAHHPVIFGGLKKLTGSNYVERTVIKAIRHNIAIYVAHTNLDNVKAGVNAKICEKLGINNAKILAPKSGLLRKLITFCPVAQAAEVRNALFAAGAGQIGNYSGCSFNTEGKGTFKASEGTKPFVGEIGAPHEENEVKIETIYPAYAEKSVLKALIESHPYEEVAYDIYPVNNCYEEVGSGMIGELAEEIHELDFLNLLKQKMNAQCIRYTPLSGKKVRKIAVCGGSGSFLLKEAISKGANVLVTSDFKYHQFFESENKIVIADIGHYESEQFTTETFYEIITKKNPTFAVRFSKINTNPINYLF